MRTLILASLVVAAGCGNDKVPQAADDPVDAAVVVDAPDDEPLTLDCASYCNGILNACGGEVAQYDSVQECLGVCEHFDAGELGDDLGNTLGCRVHHTELARLDPATHCEHAGPSGGSMCGDICDGFCAVAPAVCGAQYSAQNCDDRCAALTSEPRYSVNSTGDTVECRLYHLTKATVDQDECANTDRNNSPTCQ